MALEKHVLQSLENLYDDLIGKLINSRDMKLSAAERDEAKEMMAVRQAEIDGFLPAGMTDQEKRNLRDDFQRLMISERDPNANIHLSGYPAKIDKIFPGFAAYKKEQFGKALTERKAAAPKVRGHNASGTDPSFSVSFDLSSEIKTAETRPAPVMPAESKSAEDVPVRAKPAEPKPVQAKPIELNQSDVEEFGQSQAEHIAKLVIDEHRKGRPQAEIDKATEEYRQKQRAKTLIQQNDVEEFEQYEAEFIANVLSGTVQYTDNDKSMRFDMEAVNKYLQTLKECGKFILDITENPEKTVDYAYTDIDRILMESSPIYTAATIIGRKGTDRGYLDMLEFIQDAGAQRDLWCKKMERDAIDKWCLRDLLDLTVSASMDDLRELYDILYNLQKSADIYDDLIDYRQYLQKYSLLDDIIGMHDCELDLLMYAEGFEEMFEAEINTSDEAKAQCRRFCDFFGGIGVFGRKKPFDATKAQIYIDITKEKQATLYKEECTLEYATKYLLHKASPDWSLLAVEMGNMGIPDKEQLDLPLDDELLSVISAKKLTEIADVINEMKALQLK